MPVASIVRTLQASAEGVATLGRAWPGTRGVVPSAGPLLQDLDGLCVVDLETTGLAGGAGTQAFLVGCARIDGDGIYIRQFLSPGFEHERAQLHLVSEWMRDRTQLLTFNGRTFDVPLLEMRFSYHRLAWPWGALPHLDALHPARRFWRDRSELAGPDPDESSCTLGVLERRLSGLHRVGDVPGFEIPSRYFQFARDGRPEPLEAVLEHNRLDLLSTLLVCARGASLVVLGPGAAESGYECLGLGRLHDRLAQRDEAEACYAQAAAIGGQMGDGRLRGEALRRLALLRRRGGRAEAAAEAWRELLAHARRSPCWPGARPARRWRSTTSTGRTTSERPARLVLDALAEPLDGRRRGHAAASPRAARAEAQPFETGRPDRAVGRRAVDAIQSVGLNGARRRPSRRRIRRISRRFPRSSRTLVKHAVCLLAVRPHSLRAEMCGRTTDHESAVSMGNRRSVEPGRRGRGHG